MGQTLKLSNSDLLKGFVPYHYCNNFSEHFFPQNSKRHMIMDRCMVMRKNTEIKSLV